MPGPTTVDAYAAALSDQPRDALDTIRRLIATHVSGVQQSIRYQMPVFTFGCIYLVYVGAWKHHIGLYPIPALRSSVRRPSETWRLPHRSGQPTCTRRVRRPS